MEPDLVFACLCHLLLEGALEVSLCFTFLLSSEVLRSRLHPPMLQHKPLSVPHFSHWGLRTFVLYFKWLIPHSVRLSAVIAIPKLNYWLFASKSISFPLPHSFGTDQLVLSWLLKGRFSLKTSAAPVGRCWKRSALRRPLLGTLKTVPAACPASTRVCEVLCTGRGLVSKKEMFWVYAGTS